MKKFWLMIVAIILILSMTACSESAIQNIGKEINDSLSNLKDADNKYVQMVKNGYREDNPNLTYDTAFSAFFGTPRWSYFTSDENLDVVEFTGDCTYMDVPVKARLQFVVDEDNGTFNVEYLSFNEVPQNLFTTVALLEKVFENSEDEVYCEDNQLNLNNEDYVNSDSAVSAPSTPKNDNNLATTIPPLPKKNDYPGEVLYKGIPVSKYIGRSIYQVSNDFGNPLAEGWYLNGLYYEYDGIHFCFDERTEIVTSISNPNSTKKKLDVFEIDGIKLDKLTRSGLIASLGNPTNEEWLYDIALYMTYYYPNYVLEFKLKDEEQINDICWDIIVELTADDAIQTVRDILGSKYEYEIDGETDTAFIVWVYTLGQDFAFTYDRFFVDKITGEVESESDSYIW